ncbi:MAG TPA: hypothetical protein VI704_03705 [Bacteroidota bacterium]|nr:hypothetical protein [Bacteroidota bacterium]
MTNIANRTSKVLACLILVVASLQAQGSKTKQLLTLRVMELNKIDLVGGSVMLVINNVDPKDLHTLPSANAKTTLVWTSNGESKKITVATNGTSPKYSLRVAAENITPRSEVAASEVTFSDYSTHDLIVGVSKSSGRCVIRFTTVTSVEQGTGLDMHVITFTITSS